MTERTIPQRELRNNIGEILREAEAGVEFTITVRGRPVAKLGPARAAGPRIDVPWHEVAAMLSEHPVDDNWAADLAELRAGEALLDDPWE